MKFARGEYILFVDSDDLISKTALEELYNVAEKFQADVVQYERLYKIELDGKTEIESSQSGVFVTEPTLEKTNFMERLNDFMNKRFIWGAGGKFFRRDLIIENDIKFLNIKSAEDVVFSLCLLCFAKNWVRVPNIFYFYRRVENSITNKSISSLDVPLRNNFGLMVKAAEYLDKLLDEQEFFKAHSEGKIFALDVLLNITLPWYISMFKIFPVQQLDRVIREELKSADDTAALTSILFLRMNKLHLALSEKQTEIKSLQKQIQELQK